MATICTIKKITNQSDGKQAVVIIGLEGLINQRDMSIYEPWAIVKSDNPTTYYGKYMFIDYDACNKLLVCQKGRGNNGVRSVDFY